MRIEALPTPSEHIPALMERVKPIYLFRTYGVPLPNKDDPTQNWEPEVFLDKLARMKGRLLKHGEPDLDSVAKIMLSDWVRGRIPFFVPPPERPEELNETEAKLRKVEVDNDEEENVEEEANEEEEKEEEEEEEEEELEWHDVFEGIDTKPSKITDSGMLYENMGM